MTSSSDIQNLVSTVKSQDGKIDVLINNAGVNTYPDHSPASVKQMLDVNFRGTVDMCRAFIPLLSDHGRIVNMSSVASQLHIYSKHNQARFRGTNSIAEVEDIAKDYMVSNPP